MKPVLLLIPGMFNTTAVWDPVVAALNTHADAPDIRIADVLTQETINAMADDAWSLVSDLPAGTPLVVCGFSMGGYVALDLLAAHPGRVHGLAMVDSSAAVETPESTVLREKTITALGRNFERTVEGIIPFSLHPDSLQDAALVGGMRTMMHAVGAAAAIRQTRAVIGRNDHRPLLATLRLPTLIVCGREDKVTPPAASEELLRLLPHAQLAWIDNAGHQTPLEQAPTVARHLLALIASVLVPAPAPATPS
jgi:pimeloyl-ACP methyl ester carboxylesterase